VERRPLPSSATRCERRAASFARRRPSRALSARRACEQRCERRVRDSTRTADARVARHSPRHRTRGPAAPQRLSPPKASAMCSATTRTPGRLATSGCITSQVARAGTRDEGDLLATGDRRARQRQHLGLHALGVDAQALAHRRRPNVIAAAQEQARREGSLEPVHAPAQRRFVDAQRARSGDQRRRAQQRQQEPRVIPLECSLR